MSELLKDAARTRIPYGAHGALRKSDDLILKKRGGGERVVSHLKWWLDRNTPVGEPADLLEVMPHQGRRFIERRNIIAVFRALAAKEPSS